METLQSRQLFDVTITQSDTFDFFNEVLCDVDFKTDQWESLCFMDTLIVKYKEYNNGGMRKEFNAKHLFDGKTHSIDEFPVATSTKCSLIEKLAIMQLNFIIASNKYGCETSAFKNGTEMLLDYMTSGQTLQGYPLGKAHKEINDVGNSLFQGVDDSGWRIEYFNHVDKNTAIDAYGQYARRNPIAKGMIERINAFEKNETAHSSFIDEQAAKVG
jgi:hypothetical protein